VNQKFTGKERDVETGNDYFGARYLSAAQGRWTSPDSSSGPSSVPYADIRDPQTLNLYGYVRDNPLRLVDANGHFFQELWNWVRGNGWINNKDLEKKKTQVTVAVDYCTVDGQDPNPQNASPSPSEQAAQMREMMVALTPLLLMAPELAGDGSTEETAASEMAAESGWVRVGRWMSQEELESMQTTGAAQESRALGGSRVAFPANSEAYKDAAAGSLYVEYDIPASAAKPAGSGWARIPGPNSVEGRAAAAAGRPAPEMPTVKNVEVVKSK
jgi:RHS repeat-associated protein